MGGDRGIGGGGRGPGPPPGKLQSCHLFPRRKTGTNFPREATPPPPLPPLELSGSTHAYLTVEFYFLSSFFAYSRLISYYTSSADAQAELRLCCLHATKSSFSQQGTYGMG